MIDAELMRRAQAALDDLLARYPEAGPVRLEGTELPGSETLAYAVPERILLVAHNFTPERTAWYGREWGGYVVDASVEGVIAHEFGHAFFRRATALLGHDAAWEAVRRWSGSETVEGLWNRDCVSPYAQENQFEWIAEAFVAKDRGRANAGAFSERALQAAEGFWSEVLARMAPAAAPEGPAPTPR